MNYELVGRVDEVLGFPHNSMSNLAPYRLGRARERFRGNPTCLKLLDEIVENFNGKEYVPNFLEITLKRSYSHRTIRRVFGFIGYRLNPLNGDFRHFNVWRVR